MNGIAVLAATLLAIVAVAAVVLARGEEDERAAPAVDAGPVHVHGLGIDPADGSLLIATHTGTYRVARDAAKAERIGDSRQDTMGFTVVGPNHFLGSGHPDFGEAVERQLPPHLGLIESRDAGRTWRPVSLLGEADFHVLRVADGRVYGYDASGDRLLASIDGGRTWSLRSRPAPLLDLAVDPGDADRLVASGEGGLYGSNDGGRTWTRAGEAGGFLAWPSRGALYRITGDGTVRSARDVRGPWRTVGSVGGEPAALHAQSKTELYAALHDGTIKRSVDGGRTWSIRSAP